MQNKNMLLNYIKGCGCIGVVFIHFMFPGAFGYTLMKISQFAVPVFFMISGFYAYNNTSEKLHKKLIRILRITLFSIMLYFCFTCCFEFLKQNLFTYTIQLLNPGLWINMVFLCDLDFINGGVLWFLPAFMRWLRFPDGYQ